MAGNSFNDLVIAATAGLSDSPVNEPKPAAPLSPMSVDPFLPRRPSSPEPRLDEPPSAPSFVRIVTPPSPEQELTLPLAASEREGSPLSDEVDCPFVMEDTFLHNEFLWALCETYNNSPEIIKATIRRDRFFELAFEILETIPIIDLPHVNHIPSIVITWARFEEQQFAVPVERTPRDHAKALMGVLFNLTACNLMSMEYNSLKEVLNIDGIHFSEVFEQLCHCIQTTAVRIYKFSDLGFWAQAQVEGFRAVVDSAARRACVILGVLHRNGPSPPLSLLARTKLNWMRRQKSYISIRAMRTGEADPVPPFPHSRIDIGYRTESGDDDFPEPTVEDLTQALSEGFEPQMFKAVAGYVGSMTGKATASVADAALSHWWSEFSNSTAYKTGAAIAEVGAKVASAIAGAFSKLVEMFPVLMPVFAAFAAFMFRQTGSFKWAAIVVFTAMAGGFHLAKWFHEKLLPALYRAWHAFNSQMKTAEASTETDLNQDVFDSLDIDFEADDSTTSRFFTFAKATLGFVTSEKAPEYTTQGFLDSSLSNDVIAGAVSTALLGTGVFLKDSHGIISAFSKFSAVTSGLTGLIKVFTGLAVWLLDALEIDYSRAKIPGLNGRDVQVSAFLDKLIAFISRYNKDLLPKTELSLVEARCLVNDGRQILVHCAGSPLSQSLNRRLEDLEKIRLALEKKIGSTALMKAPATLVALFGDSGTYKSQTALTLASCLVRHELRDDPGRMESFRSDQGQMIFFVPSGEHFDGADEQTLVIIDDDFLQQVPGYSSVSPGASMIKMNNPARWNPPMAELSKKNSVFLRQKYTILSSNVKTIKDKTMECPEALGRRMNFMYKCDAPKDAERTWTCFQPLKMKYHVQKMDPRSRDIVPVTPAVVHNFTEMFYLVVDHQKTAQEYFARTQGLEEDIFEAIKDFPVENKEELKKKFKSTLWVRPGAENRVQEEPETVAQAPVKWETIGVPEQQSLFPDQVVERDLRNLFGDNWGTNEVERRRRAKVFAVTLVAHKDGLSFNDASAAVCRFATDNPKYWMLPKQKLEELLQSDDWRSAYLDTIEHDPSLKISDISPIEARSWFTSLRTAMGETLHKIKDYFVTSEVSFTSPPVIALMSGIFAAIGLKSFYDRYMTGSEESGERFVRTNKEKQQKKASDLARNRSRANRNKVFDAQSSLQTDQISDLIRSRQETISLTKTLKNGKVMTKKLGTALPVTATHVVVPRHFFTEAAYAAEDGAVEKVVFEFESETLGKSVVDFDDISFESDPDDLKVDRCLLRVLDPQWKARKNIVKHFATESAIKNLTNAMGYSPTGVLVYPKKDVSVRLIYSPVIKVTYGVVGPDDTGERLGSIGYMKTTTYGDCGVALIADEGRETQAKVISIHYAGNGKMGQSAPVSRDWLITCITGSEPKELEGEKIEQLDPHKLDFHGNAVTEYITRHAEPPSRVFMGCDLLKFAPAGEENVPKPYAMGASDTNPRTFTPNREAFQEPVLKSDMFIPKYIDPIVDDIVQTIKKADESNTPCVKLTFDEAINGNPIYDLDPIDLSTSPGYPFTSVGVTRKHFFRINSVGRRIPGPKYHELVDQLAYFDSLMMAGFDIPCIWQIIQKSEKRKLAKIREGKTRDVNCGPFPILILSIMYFGAAVGKIKKGAPMNEFLITTAPTRADEWNTLASYLSSLSGGKNVGAGDFAGFDHSHFLEMLRDVPCEVFRRLYAGCPEPERRAREILFRHIYNPTLIFGSVVERRRGCMPSGSLVTTPFNCIINAFLFRFAWLELHDFDITVIPTFHEHVRPVFCGDDNIFEVSNAYADLFTEYFLSISFARLGYRYTAADKTEAKRQLSPLENHTMLKRGFRFEKMIGKYVGPLDFDSAIEICMWSKRGAEFNKIGASNCTETLRELSLHGKDVYDEWMPKVVRHGGTVWQPQTTNWEVIFRSAVDEIEYAPRYSEDEWADG